MRFLNFSPPPINDGLVSAGGNATSGFRNHLSEMHQTLTNFVRSGEFTTVAGNATQSIPVAGDTPDSKATTQDFALVVVKTAGATPRSIVQLAAGNGVITVKMSGDPGNDHVLAWILFRLS